MEQEQKVDMDLVKKEIKNALVFQSLGIIQQGEAKNTGDFVGVLAKGLNIGSHVGDIGFTAMVVGFVSGWLSAKGTDVIQLDLDILEPIEEVIVDWASELGIDIS